MSTVDVSQQRNPLMCGIAGLTLNTRPAARSWPRCSPGCRTMLEDRGPDSAAVAIDDGTGTLNVVKDVGGAEQVCADLYIAGAPGYQGWATPGWPPSRP